MNKSKRRHWRRPDVFIINFEHILHLFVVFLLLTLIMYLLSGFVYRQIIEDLLTIFS